LLRGALWSDAQWLTRSEITAHAARFNAQAIGAPSSGMVLDWCDTADVSRWIPASANAYLKRRLGAKRATELMAVPSTGGTSRDTDARCELIDLLLSEYAPLMCRGRKPA
jgi:hypothetical protein